MTHIEKILAEFDKRFELEAQGCSECGGFELIDKKEEQFPKGKYHCEYDLEKIKAFLITSIKQALAEEREKLVEVIRNQEGASLPDLYSMSDDIISKADLLASLDKLTNKDI